jgi:hypothetical protein
VTVQYLRDQRHAGVVQKVLERKFPFPNEDNPGLETINNVAAKAMAVGKHNGEDLFPDLVIVRRPGQWLELMAQIEMDDSVTDEAALDRWKPMAEVGDLLIYVPAGMVPEAKQLCKRHGIRPKGIRTWRFVPVWGLQVAEA